MKETNGNVLKELKAINLWLDMVENDYMKEIHSRKWTKREI